MSDRVAGAGDEIGAVVAALYRSDSRKVLATLIRLLGDFDLAEEAVQDAFKAAVEQWPRDGVPANPVPWLVSAGVFGSSPTAIAFSRASGTPPASSARPAA